MSLHHITWYLVIGALLVAMALTGSWVKRLPLTTALLYLGAGVLLGPLGLGLLDLDIRAHARLWEHLTEIAVLISLFSAGLKLRMEGWSDPRWRMAMRLAFGSMTVTVGLIALAYGLSLLVHAYGFLAVFAAGAALRRIEQLGPPAPPPPDVQGLALSGQAESLATLPETAHAYMAQAVLVFNEQMEDIWEVAIVLILGGALYLEVFDLQALWFVPLLFLVIRPAAVWVGLIGTPATRYQKGLMGWFGIRGIGSLYYLAYALNHGLPEELAGRLVSLVLACVAASIVVHGISATPLMEHYAALTRRHAQRQGPPRR